MLLLPTRKLLIDWHLKSGDVKPAQLQIKEEITAFGLNFIRKSPNMVDSPRWISSQVQVIS